jgi:hypothetical protein
VAITRLDETTLRGWVDYANASKFPGVLKTLHKKWIEYDRLGRGATVSPTGARYVETSIALEVS